MNMKKIFAISLALMLIFSGFSVTSAAVGGEIEGSKSTTTIPGEPLHPEDVYLIGQAVNYNLVISNTHPDTTMIVDITDNDPGGFDAILATDEVIPAGESWNSTYTYVVDADDIITLPGGLNVIRNSLHAIGDQGIEAVEVLVTKSVLIVQPDITVSKTTDSEISKVGDSVYYTIRVENTGDWPLEGITINDPLLGGDITSQFTFPSTPGVLDVGEFVESTIEYVVEEGKVDPLDNEVTARGIAEGFDEEIVGAAVEATDTATVKLVVPSIDLTKSVSPTIGLVGDTVTYTVTIENTGDWELVNITVNDTLMGDLSAHFPDTLAIGESFSYNYDYTILETDLPGPIMNTADVYSNPFGLPNDIIDEDSAEVVIPNPAIDVEKQADPLVSKVGDEVEYYITVENIGDWPLENVTVTDPLLGGDITDQFTFVGSGDPFLGELLPGDMIEATITYIVEVGKIDPLENTVTAQGDVQDIAGATVSDVDSASVQLVVPSIDLTKSVSPTIGLVGDTVTYTVSIENTGDWELVNITVNDTLMGDLSAHFPDTLAIGESFSYNYDYTILETDLPGPIMNTADVYSNPFGLPNDIIDEDSAEVMIANPAIDVEKQAYPLVSKVGDEVEYYITVENIGDWPLENVTVTDPLLGGDITDQFTFVGSGDPFLGELLPGEMIEATITYIVEVGKIDPLENTVTAQGDVQDIADATVSDVDSASVQLVVPSIDLIKSVTPIEGYVGDVVTYTVSIVNTGDWGLENIAVVDSMMGDLSAHFPDTLAIGESFSYNYDYTILETDLPGPIMNTATVHSNPVGLPNDITDEDSAEVTILAMCYEDETAWAFGNIDFIEDLNLSNWGWSNGPLGEGTYERDLFAGKDMLVGKVTIEYLDGCVTVFYNLDPGYELMETHVWISETSPLPYSMRKDMMVYNSAPGQLGYYGDTEYCGFEGELYIAAHAVVRIPVPCQYEPY